ncbi:HAD hydrolase, partial [Punctularia strigosozonata HHB-11173 SS5]|uniref:HAD hydrolase n=1 Tax=Punctularia strigosozonata (strain HHB-11173) TaxID=741275 RepID=UPI0004417C1D
PPVGFIFDIDGVLLRGSEVLPEAKEVFRILNGDNRFSVKLPYIFLTNGGGVSEADRSRKLTKQFGISPDQIVQAHTILTSPDLVERYADAPVLVLGGINDVCRKVAEGYGYKHVYTPLDIKAALPDIWPFYSLSPEERASVKHFDPSTRFGAAFVFHDPRNWGMDTQILLDIVLGSGSITGPITRLRASEPERFPVYFCNPDLLWRSSFPRSRLGQGAFIHTLQNIYHQYGITEPHYEATIFGKPTSATFKFAARVMDNRVQSLVGLQVQKDEQPTLSVVYVGLADICGANAASIRSILVHTGVYDPANGPPRHTPWRQAPHVLEAVTIAIDEEYRRLGSS